MDEAQLARLVDHRVHHAEKALPVLLRLRCDVSERVRELPGSGLSEAEIAARDASHAALEEAQRGAIAQKDNDMRVLKVMGPDPIDTI